ncbi:DUF1405 domain-containing protein [Salinibaculum rarum]|uniref:DUF1405 domain-containing protein n=1 Tax=Salinibaculum rarum TaxID=3058903 RepID=UPI00265D7132|nr:DUF1405 domain-containing protein [Salinibaculum sp. KK48]
MDRLSPIPRRWARLYLSEASNLVALLAVNGVAVLVGIRFYVAEMVAVSTALWPFFLDSPVALAIAMLSLATLLPTVGADLDSAPVNLALAYLHTLAFVWLVKMGLWTALALGLGFDQYYPAPWDFFGIVLTHLAFVAEAFLIPHYGRTTRGALAVALGLALVNDALDYGLGLHPPLRYDPGLALVAGTVLVSVGAVVLAAVSLPRLDKQSR